MNDKKISLIRCGYYHPSNANWSYHIWLVIDKTGARFYRESFGGDYQMIEKQKANGIEVEKLQAGIGTDTEYKWSAVKQMPDLENYELNW